MSSDKKVFYSFPYLLNILKKSVFILIVYMLFMSSVRIYLLSTNYLSTFPLSDLLSALFLGFRLDISILGYVFTPIILFLIVISFFNFRNLVKVSFLLVRYYLIVILIIISLVLFSDIAFFSYFFEHINIMIFGIFDDDTKALFEIAKQNYNLFFLSFGILSFFLILFIFISRVLSFSDLDSKRFNILYKILFFVGTILITFLVIRGSFGTFPLSKYIPDTSEIKFINILPQNGIYALKTAFKDYKNSKEDSYDLIKQNGYKGRMDKAFELYLNDTHLNTKNLTKNLIKMTSENPVLKDNPPHVVVVMVESFGLPILKYQSESFNIMGSLEKHFDKDTVFKNFISTGNGTISSLEALLLNITSRPKSTPLSQSRYLSTQFQSAAAKVYQSNGYETSFVYGGDLSWRNVGTFYAKQGFDNVYGKAAVTNRLNLDMSKVSHEWGVFDEISYKFVIDKLKKATKPQFIFLLTTNNHPPYNIPHWYKSKSLKISDDLENHLSKNSFFALKRFKDYGYALDSAGIFMDQIKSSPLNENTIIGITADNNTIEGMMRYDNYYNESKKIPFYLYLPPYLKKEYDITIPGSHKDLFPTIYNVSLSSTPYISVGTDLADTNILHCGFNKAGVLMSKDGGFNAKIPKSISQNECADYYKAVLSISEYLLNEGKSK